MMIQHASRIAATLIAFSLPLAMTATAMAADWPGKPIRFIVPYAPGGTDSQLRALAPTLEKLLGQHLVIENKPGGGASIGASYVKNAAADGYTLLYTGTGALTVIPNLTPQNYSYGDFVPIGNAVGTPFVIATTPNSPFRTIGEMVAYARANPDKLSFGSAGYGTTTHMTGAAMALAAGIKLVHVPFQGISPAVTALMGGHIDMAIGLPSAIMPQVAAGKLLALASAGSERIDILRDVPTLRESGIDATDVTKFGLFAPKGTPEEAIATLTAALRKAIDDPQFQHTMRAAYNNVMYLEPGVLEQTVEQENAYYRELIDTLGLKK